MKKLSPQKFIVVYALENGLYVSEPFDDYDAAFEYAYSEDGADENKAVIISAGANCDGSEIIFEVEDHT